MKKIIIDESMSDQRLDRFLQKLYKVRSKNSVHKWIRKKLIKVNGKKQTPDFRLSVGDELKIFLPDDLLETSIIEANAKLEKKAKLAGDELDIVYENSEILVVNKPAGVLVHPAEGEYQETLSTIVKTYLHSYERTTFSPASVSRLDYNTEGLVLFCKTYEAIKRYNQMMKDGEIEKFYLAVCEGKIESDCIVDGHLEKDEEKNKVSISRKQSDNSKYIRTGIKVLKRYETADKSAYTLAEIRLYTGRTHQIRASLASIGHPICGDKKYGAKRYSGIDYQVLAAYKLVLPDMTISYAPSSVESALKSLKLNPSDLENLLGT